MQDANRRGLHAEQPMEAARLDVFTSEYLVAAGDDQGDDTPLMPSPAVGPLVGLRGPDPIRPVRYTLLDLCTGAARSRYFWYGMSDIDAFDFLCWAFTPADGVLLHGVPDVLWVDHGPLFEAPPARDLLFSLGVKLARGGPPGDRGWPARARRFEQTLFADSVGLRSERITLGEVNARLQAYEELLDNETRTLTARGVLSRAEAWRAFTSRRPVRRLPAELLRTLAREVGGVEPCS